MAVKRPDSSENALGRVSTFLEYRLHLHGYLLRCIRHETDVKDLMQEIALGFMKVPHGVVIEAPERYLFTIARNVMRSYFARKKARSAVIYDSEAADRGLEKTEDSGMSEAESQAIQQDLLRAIQRLPRAQYDVLRLRMETDLSCEAIAQQLGMPENTVKKYLFIAKATLRRGES